jgi:hypothetical protein
MPPPPPGAVPARASSGLPVPVAVVLGLLIAAIVGVGFSLVGNLSDANDGDDEGDPLPSGEPAVRDAFAARELEVGDCWDDMSGGGLAGARPVACDGPHDAEVLLVFAHPAGLGEAFPGEDALFDHGVERCLPTFEGLVGDDLTKDIIVVFPKADSWSIGDRELSCSMVNLDGSPLDPAG